ncbi:OsmC family protein [Pollutimonas bauzanensis]|uniref:Uncharacterized OsmC-related protein n=1 Tax=Pollutimonas bauzanensis TaxID=658167 RepID=A0A1M5V8J9_9BURK|nr:OsmC family protein [Pollutimonas bauzanensis]SHH71545.1 Uncharacterized OsmC-related protein [Pollutimonas bauzanensis]
MSTLREYLHQKRAALLERNARDPVTVAPNVLTARASAEGRSGVRRIRIRHHQVISDSPADFAGYDLGPASPELLLGSLSSCLTHIFLIQASDLQIPLDRLEVEVQADQDTRGGRPGYEEIPFYPHNIRYAVHIDSPASKEQIDTLHAAVEKWCPILNLLQNPQALNGTIVHNQTH